MSDHYTKNIEDWRKAGKIAAEALEFGRLLIVKGAKVLDVCNQVDEKIRTLDAQPAFPTQLSLNSTAAHFCPDKDDIELTDQVVKLDVGVVVNGAIGDNACTVDLSEKNAALVTASRDALEAAIRIIRPGTTLGEIGRTIQKTIESAGFNPVVNLSGHGLDYNDIHCSPTIPNFDTEDDTELEEGMVFAIEPFASTGAGKIKEAGNATLFSQIDSKPVRMGREILQQIDSYEGLPFTKRWLEFSEIKVRLALKQFEQLGIIKSYPPLIDIGKGIVSQAEHTVLVTKAGCEVLTVL